MDSFELRLIAQHLERSAMRDVTQWLGVFQSANTYPSIVSVNLLWPMNFGQTIMSTCSACISHIYQSANAIANRSVLMSHSKKVQKEYFEPQTSASEEGLETLTSSYRVTYHCNSNHKQEQPTLQKMTINHIKFSPIPVVWLTTVLVYFYYQLDAQVVYFNTFIMLLYMFRALLCSSSGGQLY